MNNTESTHKSDAAGYEMLVLAYITLPNRQTRFAKRYWLILVSLIAIGMLIAALTMPDVMFTSHLQAVAGIQ